MKLWIVWKNIQKDIKEMGKCFLAFIIVSNAFIGYNVYGMKP